MDSLINSLILDLAPVIVLNPSSRIVKWNQGLSQIYGWSQWEALGQDAHLLLNTIFPQPLDDIERQILENGDWQGELIHTRKDGKPIIVKSHWILKLTEKGKSLAILEFISDITEYESIKDALSESIYKRLMEDSPLAIFLATLGGKAILFNSEFAQMFGYQSPEECNDLLPTTADFTVNPQRQSEMIQIIQEQSSRTAFENLYRRKDGSIFWGNLYIRQVENKGGSDSYYEGYIEDITDRKHTEDQLRETERFTQATLDSLSIHICVLDENGVILTTNQAWRDFADANGTMDPQYYRGVNYLDVCDTATGKDSAGASAFAEGIRRVMRQEIYQFSLEYTCDSPWENRWYVANVTRFNGGVSARLVISHVNITERKQSELRLSQATKRYQDLFENSGTSNVIVDEHGKYVMVNKKAANIFGRLPEDMIGLFMLDLLPIEKANRYLELNRQLLETGGNREYEDTFKLPSGQRTFLIINQCIQDENQKNSLILSSSIDITERKKAEEGLRESRERLSHLSRRLVETQEQERRRIARELHDEIGQILTALTMTLNGIQTSNTDPALHTKLSNLQELARELHKQVNALSSDLRPRVLDDLGLIPGLISMINRLAAQTGLEIDFKHGLLEQQHIPPEIEITAYRIIQEALTNVIRYANVKLAIVRIQLDGDTLWIQIQDDGNGFDYPTAINSSHSMGLIGMLERAEQVGGLLSIQTAPGEGTNITCRLALGDGFLERRKNARI